VIIAIDPGQSGAIYEQPDGYAQGHHLRLGQFYDGDLVDAGRMQDYIITVKAKKCYLEKQQSRRNQGSQQQILINYGIIYATLVLCGVEVVEVQPAAVKKFHGINAKGDYKKGKKLAIEKVEQLGYIVPMLKPNGRTRKHDGVADAILIYLYGEQSE